MKIAILTINDYNNYGNRLQNYALQEVLKSLGHETYTIQNLVINDRRNLLIRNMARIKRKIKKYRMKQPKNELDILREQSFMKFNNQHISETQFSIKNIKDRPEELNSFDGFVIGSDQVWNYQFMRFSPIDFACFSTKSQKVISYAASFGIESLPDKLVNEYRKGLQNIDAISTRENAGKKIINQIFGEDIATIVADPTFLLPSDKWVETAISSDVELPNLKYIVTYFLGTPLKEEWTYIQKYAENSNYKIIMFNNKSEEAWGFGPNEFINYLNNASAIFTDSFHACVFSIKFRKYFEVFKRRDNTLSSMNSRIETLLNHYDLQDRVHNNELKAKIDYLKVEKIMDDTVKKSIDFLKENLVTNN